VDASARSSPAVNEDCTAAALVVVVYLVLVVLLAAAWLVEAEMVVALLEVMDPPDPPTTALVTVTAPDRAFQSYTPFYVSQTDNQVRYPDTHNTG
jgi:hypothetical protein